MRRVALGALVVLGLILAGCATVIPPDDPVVTEPLSVEASATVVDRTVTVTGCITGGTAPYWVQHFCDEDVICEDPVEDPCPTCPTPCAQSPCPPVETDCCFEVVCEYNEVGSYVIVLQVADSDNKYIWVKIPVVISVAPVTEFVITSTFGPGGAISPSGNVSVESGDDATFNILAFPGYVIGDILVDGVSILHLLPTAEDLTSYVYTFEDVNKDHSIWAGFGLAEKPPSPPEI